MTQARGEGGLARCRVLVVEDEYFLADDMACALRSMGAEVIGPLPTPDAVQALLQSGARIDSAVLDINLHGETVYPVADALTERGVPFVFATGYDQGAVPAVYQAVPRWEKPFDPRDLARSLPGLVSASAG